MSKEEEAVFLAPFFEKAAKGGILVVGEIKKVPGMEQYMVCGDKGTLIAEGTCVNVTLISSAQETAREVVACARQESPKIRC